MRRGARLAAAAVAAAVVMAACGSDEADTDTTTTTAATTTTTSTTTTTTLATTTTTLATTTTTTTPGIDLALSFSGLGTLAGASRYEGWLVVEGRAISTGTFNVVDGVAVDDAGTPLEFRLEPDLAGADLFIVTVEPPGDTDPLPSAAHILAGDLVDGTAELTVSHPMALGVDFASAAGRYVLATPSTDTKDDELSGIWFLTLPGPVPGLQLPTLPEGWRYEGWVVVDGVPLTTGTFRDPAGADDAAPYGGPGRMPALPGEDFVANAPAGVTLPTDLSGDPVFVSVEPDPDDGPEPFSLVTLTGEIPADAVPEPTAYDLAPDPTGLPSGSARLG